MCEREATVRNAHGIHCRPSAVIAQAAQKHAATITLSGDGSQADAKQIIQLISLGLSCGATVTVQAEGTDEEAACATVVDLLETAFDFPPKEG